MGYQGFKSVYRPITVTTNHRKDPFFNLNPLRPKLKDVNISTTPQFQTLSNGFQRAAALSTKNVSNGLGDPFNEEVKVPVTGYTGHRMGYKSQNFFGKNQRDCSI